MADKPKQPSFVPRNKDRMWNAKTERKKKKKNYLPNEQIFIMKGKGKKLKEKITTNSKKNKNGTNNKSNHGRHRKKASTTKRNKYKKLQTEAKEIDGSDRRREIKRREFLARYQTNHR